MQWGKLGRLAIRIPWKNLYASQVILDIEELLIVLIPYNEFKYDHAKEEKWKNDKKQARLRAVEEARKRELEVGELISFLVINMHIFMKHASEKFFLVKNQKILSSY